MKIKEGGGMDIQESIEHVLKTDPAVFQGVLDGKKTFEIRFNDRGYQVGDLVVLKETKFTGQQMKSGEPLVYTGREIQKRISYVLSGYGLHEGWVILGIQDIKATKAQAVPEWKDYTVESPRIDGPYQIFIMNQQLVAKWESPWGFSSIEDGDALNQELITHWSVLGNDPAIEPQEPANE